MKPILPVRNLVIVLAETTLLGGGVIPYTLCVQPSGSLKRDKVMDVL